MKLPWESQNPWYFYGSAFTIGFILAGIPSWILFDNLLTR